MRLKLKFLDKSIMGEQLEWFAWYPVVTECNTLVWLEKVYRELESKEFFSYACDDFVEEIYYKYHLKGTIEV